VYYWIRAGRLRTESKPNRSRRVVIASIEGAAAGSDDERVRGARAVRAASADGDPTRHVTGVIKRHTRAVELLLPFGIGALAAATGVLVAARRVANVRCGAAAVRGDRVRLAPTAVSALHRLHPSRGVGALRRRRARQRGRNPEERHAHRRDSAIVWMAWSSIAWLARTEKDLGFGLDSRCHADFAAFLVALRS